jgi:hypothetical protein
MNYKDFSCLFIFEQLSRLTLKLYVSPSGVVSICDLNNKLFSAKMLVLNHCTVLQSSCSIRPDGPFCNPVARSGRLSNLPELIIF